MINRVVSGIYEAKCDRCGQTDEFKAGNRDHARRRFLVYGWQDGAEGTIEEIICPDCVAVVPPPLKLCGVCGGRRNISGTLCWKCRGDGKEQVDA